MTTDHARAFALARLSDCPDLDALRRVWEGLADHLKRDPAIAAHKDRLKEQMK